MIPLTEGALDKIMMGVDVDKPILQILGHKKLASSSSGERFRLLISDGKSINSFTMLATQLNSMITDNVLTEFSICQINRYAMSMVNNSGKQKRVMVILNLDIKVPGENVGCKIGNPTSGDSTAENNADAEANCKQGQSVQQKNGNAKPNIRVNQPSSANIITTPISALSPYQNKWVIKARVTSKSNVRTWSNSRGEGKLFSMDLVDESGEIRCTAFRDQCDKFYDMLEVGKIYYISQCILKPANKNFCTLKNNYEMSMTSDTELVQCHEDVDDIPTIQFDFVSISAIESKEKNDLIDILGVVKNFGDVQTIRARSTGKELKKRDINLVDESNNMICLTLWGSDAEQFDGSNNPIVAIKGARIGEFRGGKNISTISSSTMQIDPDIPEAHKLRGWYNTVGQYEEAKCLSIVGATDGGSNGPMFAFKEMQQLHRERKGPEIFVARTTITMIRSDNAFYKACPSEGCNKKLIDQANDMYRCEKCDKEYPNFKYRVLLNLSVADWSSSLWVTAFHEEAEKLLSMSGDEIGSLYENDKDTYQEKFSEASFQTYFMKFRAKIEMFNDESRLRCVVLSTSPVNYETYNDILLKQIKEISGIENI